MKAPGATMHDRQAKCARKVNKAARTLVGWLDVWREAVRDGDWDAAFAARRQVLEAEAQLDRARRAHENAAQWARVERRGSLFRG